MWPNCSFYEITKVFHTKGNNPNRNDGSEENISSPSIPEIVNIVWRRTEINIEIDDENQKPTNHQTGYDANDYYVSKWLVVFDIIEFWFWFTRIVDHDIDIIDDQFILPICHKLLDSDGCRKGKGNGTKTREVALWSNAKCF